MVVGDENSLQWKCSKYTHNYVETIFLQLLWTRKHCECEDSAEHGCTFFLGEVNRLIRVQCTRCMHVSEFAISFYMYNIFNSIKICICVCVSMYRRCTVQYIYSVYANCRLRGSLEKSNGFAFRLSIYAMHNEKTIAMGKKGGCKILTLCVYKGEREKE